MIQTLFQSNDAIFQLDSVPVDTAGTVQSWCEKPDGELQHLPLYESIPRRIKAVLKAEDGSTLYSERNVYL
jgi:hypothetical protein